MRVLMVVQHINLFRNLETVVRELDARGHETVLLHGTRLDSPKARTKFERKRETMVFQGRGIAVAEGELSGLSSGLRVDPVEGWQGWLRVGRLVVNRGLYFRKGHPSPERVVGGLEKMLPGGVRRALGWRLVRWVLGLPVVLRGWRWVEGRSRASESVVELMRRLAPDVVLVSPSVWPKNPVEADYLRAARALGVPSVGYVNSWDNLTSKGTVHVLPDVFVVWNEAMAAEAREIHLIPSERIEVTGAPHMDHFFALSPSRGRAELCRVLGCADDGPYVVYLCSSRTLVADETPIVAALADALTRQLGEDAPVVVVRPHPVNSLVWENFSHPGVVAYPRRGDQADTPDSWQEYFDQLSGASAFVGLNTTAFLEAAVADRPCLTIVSDEFFDQQGRTGHFRHLLGADFLEVSSDVEEVADRIGRILHGADDKAEQRKHFTKTFLRPQGLNLPAQTIVADLLEHLANDPTHTNQQPPPITTA